MTCSMAVMQENDFGYLHLRLYMQTEGTPGLVNKTPCGNILFCFTAVISLRGFFFFFSGGVGSPSLCVLVKIDRHPCVTK